MPNVTLIDYGSGNLLNVARAFEHLGAEVTGDRGDMFTEGRGEAGAVGRLHGVVFKMAAGDGAAAWRLRGATSPGPR